MAGCCVSGVLAKRWMSGGRGCTCTQLERGKEADDGSVIHRADYHAVLMEECARLGVDVKLGADVQDVDFEGTSVTLANGEIVAGDVIIGADGSVPSPFTASFFHSHI